MIDQDLLRQAEEEFEDSLDEYMAEWEASLEQAMQKPTANVFCPTGKDGGVDPHCGKDGGHGSHLGPHAGPGVRPPQQKTVTKELVLSTVKSLVGKFNHAYISDVGERLGLSPQELLPHIQQLRRDGILTGSALEGRSGISEKQKKYVTSDGVGIISLRE